MSRQNDVGHVLSRAPVLEAAPGLEAVANGSPEGLSKAWAACGDSVESRVSDGSAPFCAIYRAFARRWWEESVMSSSRRRNRYSKVSVCPIAMMKC